MLVISGKGNKEKENVLLTGYDPLRDRPPNLDDAFVISNNSVTPGWCVCSLIILAIMLRVVVWYAKKNKKTIKRKM